MFACPLAEAAELRPLEPWNAEDLFTCVESARDDLAAWTVVAARVHNIEDARRLLNEYAQRRARDTGHYYGIWWADRLVGAALFRAFDARSRSCEIGVWIIPPAQGRGLATRALHRSIDWAIGERGMQRVQFQTSPHNPHGRKLARRLGMTSEGVLRSAMVIGGVRHDSEVWSVLAPEWLERSRHTGVA